MPADLREAAWVISVGRKIYKRTTKEKRKYNPEYGVQQFRAEAELILSRTKMKNSNKYFKNLFRTI